MESSQDQIKVNEKLKVKRMGLSDTENLGFEPIPNNYRAGIANIDTDTFSGNV